MNFPCKDCIVDSMCITPCELLSSYLKDVSYIDPGYNITLPRLKRLGNLITVSLYYFNHYTNAYKRYRLLEQSLK